MTTKVFTEVKITFENGRVICTKINLSFEDAKEYYLGRNFELTEEGGPVKVVSVEEL